MQVNAWFRIGVLAAVAGAGVLGYFRVYQIPRQRLLDQIEASTSAAKAIEKQLRGEFEVADRTKAAGKTTLGAKFDAASARFRDGLSRVAESQGLSSITVDHGEPQPVPSPLLNVRGVPTALKSALRRPSDFEILRGNVKGVGTLEQVLRALALAQAQPWLHRIEGFSIKPANKERDRFELRLEVATLFAPAFTAGPDSEPALATIPAGRESLWNAIVLKHAFSKPGDPPPPAPAVAVAAPSDAGAAPTPQQRFAPYEDWKLTGVVVGKRGPEAFFVNVKTGERTTVQKGAAVLDAVFVGGEGEHAWIEIGGKRFEIVNGETLAARRPVG